MKLINKKGQVSGLQGFVVALIGISVVLIVGLLIITDLRDTELPTGHTRYNSTHSSSLINASGVSEGANTSLTQAYLGSHTILERLATAPTWIGLIITVGFAFAVLAFFKFRQ